MLHGQQNVKIPYKSKPNQLPELHSDTSTRNNFKAQRFKPQILMVTYDSDLRSILVLQREGY